MADVGTNRIYEDDEIVAWELFLEPGATIARHTHELPYAIYVFQGSHVRAFDADGEEVADVEVESGSFMMFRREEGEFVVGAGPDQLRVPATHSLMNVGEGHYKEIMIEFKE